MGKLAMHAWVTCTGKGGEKCVHADIALWVTSEETKQVVHLSLQIHINSSFPSWIGQGWGTNDNAFCRHRSKLVMSGVSIFNHRQCHLWLKILVLGTLLMNQAIHAFESSFSPLDCILYQLFLSSSIGYF